MKKKQGMMIGFAVLMMAALFTMAGCKDPVTGETLLTGNLKVINKDDTIIYAVRLSENNATKVVWEAQDLGAEKGNIPQDQDKIWSDVPAGTWRIQVGGQILNDVVISAGLTTTVTLQSSGSLVAGIPL
jgi:hypothetical protein